MRLIDADELLRNLKEEIPMAEDVHIFKDIINNQPTAYNVDKVIKELDERSIMVATSKEFYEDPQNGEYVANVVELRKAIEIVKDGVRND